jgi:hypothetical protein
MSAIFDASATSPSTHSASQAIARRRALSLLTSFPLFLAGYSGGRSDDLTMPTFRSEVLAVLRRHFPDKTFSEGADEAAIKYDNPAVPNLGKFNFYLGNLFASVRGLSHDDREDAVVRYFAQQLELETIKAHRDEVSATWEGARALLRPRLIPVDYLKTQNSLLHRDFSHDVMIAYSLDLGKFDEFVSDTHASKWGVTIDTIHPTTIANLEALSKDIPIKVRPASGGAPGGFAAVDQHDAYDAARLLLPQFRSRIIAELGDFVYAGIPNRDFLVVWSRDFAAHAGFVAKIKKDSQTQPYPLTDEIFVITASGVRPATRAETTRAP